MSTRLDKRKLAKQQFDKQITKERAIGIDPIFHHRKYSLYSDVFKTSKDWKKKSEEYDKALQT